MSARYAIYFAPPPASPLGRFGRAWLGDAASVTLSLEAISPDRLREITAAPRHYGFHATLKPPFALADGCRIDDLERAVGDFAGARRPFAAPPLTLNTLAGFIALMLGRASDEMTALAADCVQAFDRFRRPADPAGIDRRRAAGLTPRQARHLVDWGYPYVMDDFRFHMTLTGRLDEPERSAVLDGLRPLVEPLCHAALEVGAVALFAQSDRARPFHLCQRYPLAA